MAKNLTAIFSARDRISDKLNSMSESGGQLTSTLSSVAKVGGAAFLALGTAIAGVAAKGVLDFAKFEKGMNEVFTLLPGITQSGMDEMSEQVRKFSKEMGVLPQEVVPALYQSLSAGVPQENVFSFLETAQKAAIGGITTVETAVDGLTSVVNAYGSDVVDVNKASDLMFTTVRLGKTNFEQLSASLGQVLPSATAAGVKFEDVSAGLSTLTAKGIRTAEASTKLRSAIDELAKPSTQISKTFNEIANKDFRTFISEGNNLSDAMNLLKDHADKTGVKIGDMFSSVEAASAATFLTNDDTFVKHLSQMTDAAGATDAAYSQMDKGLARTWERIKANASVALLDIGDSIAPYLENVATAFLDLLPKLQEILGNILTFVSETFGKIFDVMEPIAKDGIEKLKEVFSFGKELGEALIDSIVFAFSDPSDLQSAFQGFKEVIVNGIYSLLPEDLADGLSDKFVQIFDNMLEGIQPLVDSIMNLGQSIFENIEGAIPNFLTVFDNIYQIVSSAIENVVSIVEEVIIPTVTAIIDVVANTFVPAISSAFDFIVNTVLPPFMNIFNFLSEHIFPIIVEVAGEVFPHLVSIIEGAFMIIQGLWEGVLSPVLSAILQVFNTVWPLIANAVEVAARLIGGAVSSIIRIFDGIISFVGGVFTGNWSKAWQGVVDIFGGIFDGIVALAKAPINTVIGLVNGAIGAINSIKVPDWVPMIGGKNANISTIPMLAEGTPDWKGGQAIVGEAGAELVVGPKFGDLPRGSKVIPNDETERILSRNEVASNLTYDNVPDGASSTDFSEIEKILMDSKGSNEPVNNDNRQYTINVDSQTVAKTDDPKTFKDKVIEVIEKILDEEHDTGGDFDFEF